jgi:hypothetical protein
MPPPNDAGYSTGISQPLKSTIFAPIWRWTAFSAVLRTAGVASTEDKIDLNQREAAGTDVTAYRITRFFCGSNRRYFTAQDTKETAGFGLPTGLLRPFVRSPSWKISGKRVEHFHFCCRFVTMWCDSQNLQPGLHARHHAPRQRQ